MKIRYSQNSAQNRVVTLFLFLTLAFLAVSRIEIVLMPQIKFVE